MLAKSLGGTVGKNNDNSYEIGFFDIVPTKIGNKMFEKQKTFFQWHNEGFNVPKECLVLAEGKKLDLRHEMKNAQEKVCATCTQSLLHVDLNSRKSCPPIEPVASILMAL